MHRGTLEELMMMRFDALQPILPVRIGMSSVHLHLLTQLKKISDTACWLNYSVNLKYKLTV